MSAIDEQSIIRERVIKWYLEKVKLGKPQSSSYITIAGFAGTGKTHLIGDIASELKSINRSFSAAFVTFTGKASSVLRKRLEESNIDTEHDHFVGTIHSMMYKPYFIVNGLGIKVLAGWRKRSRDELSWMYNLIIVDEASMVNKEIWDDLCSYGIPIIAVGDHGQLPPIGDNFSILQSPTYILRTIHRQALNSPIIQLSIAARQNGFIQPGFYSRDVFKLQWNDQRCQDIFNNIQWDKNYIVLCAFNQTRVNLNNQIRNYLGFKLSEPYPGERLICLKNNHETKIMNGQLGSMVWFTHFNKDIYEITLEMDDNGEMYNNIAHNYCFGKISYDGAFDEVTGKKIKTIIRRSEYKSIDLFDFGYAISVHRSQGSEWNNVVLFEQRSSYWDDNFYKRWLYTAITRAKNKLFLISNYW